MLNKTLYPKTKRIGKEKYKVSITEKLDGSNLGLFRLDNKLIVAQRNWLFTWTKEETTLTKQNSYKGLIGWLELHGESLLNNLHEGSGFFGEWIGMGKIDYSNRLELDKKLYIFAKANIKKEENEELTATNLIYKRGLFIYPFIDQTIPEFIDIVPMVIKLPNLVDENYLNELYDNYCKDKSSNVEGFVIDANNNIEKYVRFKNGVLNDN